MLFVLIADIQSCPDATLVCRVINLRASTEGVQVRMLHAAMVVAVCAGKVRGECYLLTFDHARLEINAHCRRACRVINW